MLDNNKENQIHELRQYWNEQATSFDDEPDHGLNDPIVLNTWTRLLKTWLPLSQAKVLDIGCGTGSLSVVLAGLGHRVTGIDISPAMISQAEKKAETAGYQVSFHVMEASYPVFSGKRFDGIVCRHLLWSLPNLTEVLRHWVGLIEPGGRLLIIEGCWNTGGGLHSENVINTLPSSLTNFTVQNLSHQPGFWGRKVSDERYAIMAEKKM